MIVKILVKKKIGGTAIFDYQLKDDERPDLLSLVEVMFGTKREIGLVAGFSGKSQYKTKTIEKLLSRGSVFTSGQFKLALYISNEFLSSFGETILGFLPPLNKKDLKQLGYKAKMTSGKSSKSILILGDRDSRTTMFCQLAQAKKGQHLLIIPTISMVGEVRKKLSKIIPDDEIIVWHSGLKSEEKAHLWQKILQGDHMVVVGTRQSMFLPFVKLKTVFIDDPANFAYREDQSPYYNCYEISRQLSKISNAKFVVGEAFPDVFSFVGYKKNLLEIKQIKTQLKFNFFPDWHKGMADPNFASAITGAIKDRKKIVFVGHFKEHVGLICNVCNQTFDKGANCPNCKSEKLRPNGFSYDQIAEDIKKNVLPLDISIGFGVESLAENQVSIINHNDIDLIRQSADFFVFPYFSFMINNPELGSSGRLFRLMREIPSYGGKNVFIFGYHLNDSELTTQIKNNDFEAFYSEELIQRKKAGLPPFKKAIIISCRKRDVQNAKATIEAFLTDKFRHSGGFYQKIKFVRGSYIVEKVIFINYSQFSQFKKEALKSFGGGLSFKIDPVDFF
jgi:primosomal protein N'